MKRFLLLLSWSHNPWLCALVPWICHLQWQWSSTSWMNLRIWTFFALSAGFNSHVSSGCHFFPIQAHLINIKNMFHRIPIVSQCLSWFHLENSLLQCHLHNQPLLHHHNVKSWKSDLAFCLTREYLKVPLSDSYPLPTPLISPWFPKYHYNPLQYAIPFWCSRYRIRSIFSVFYSCQ